MVMILLLWSFIYLFAWLESYANERNVYAYLSAFYFAFSLVVDRLEPRAWNAIFDGLWKQQQQFGYCYQCRDKRAEHFLTATQSAHKLAASCYSRNIQHPHQC